MNKNQMAYKCAAPLTPFPLPPVASGTGTESNQYNQLNTYIIMTHIKWFSSL